MAKETTADLSTTGVMSRSKEEIARVLTMLLERGQALHCDLAGGELVFESKLLLVDPARAYILLEPGASAPALLALLARPRASFHASPDGWHIEFAASAPLRAEHAGKPAVRLAFPEVLATQQRRAHQRLVVEPKVSLHLVADADGPLSFDGALIDISMAGFGFLQYAPGITLEPGTLLKGCRIELPKHAPVRVDLEVRHSSTVDLPDRQRVVRSGFRFLNSTPELNALLASFFGR